MNKNRKRKRRGTIAIFLMLIILFLIVMVIVIPKIINCTNQNIDGGNTDASNKKEEIKFPTILEDNKLEITSLFPFSGINPDADMLEASNIAAIAIRNISDEYLKEATITAMSQAGNEYVFTVHDLPTQKSVIAFSVDNYKWAQDDYCVNLKADSVFENEQKTDELSVTIDGMTVIILNNSQKELSKIDVYCRDIVNEDYFGGKAYKYTIEKLSAGEETTITVSDSLFGVIDVVRVAVNN